jgi:hypothetical protein
LIMFWSTSLPLFLFIVLISFIYSSGPRPFCCWGHFHCAILLVLFVFMLCSWSCCCSGLCSHSCCSSRFSPLSHSGN